MPHVIFLSESTLELQILLMMFGLAVFCGAMWLDNGAGAFFSEWVTASEDADSRD